VYRGVFSLPVIRQEHNKAVWELGYSELRFLVKQFTGENKLTGTSHRVVAVHPSPNSEGLDDWRIEIKSVRIGEKVARLMRFAEREELRKLYHEFRVSPMGSNLAGWIFEAIIHRLLIHGWPKRDGPVPQPIPMTSNRQSPPTYTYTPPASSPPPTAPRPVRGKHRDAILIDFNDKLDDITLEDNRYYIPVASNNPLFDSFTIDCNRNKTTVISIFQITASKTHGGSAKGYHIIQDIMEQIKKLLLEDNPKTTPKVAVAYFLVRPENKNESKYTWKMPDGWNKQKLTNNYRGKVFTLRVPTSIPSSSVVG
jgi:hypothetical protein